MRVRRELSDRLRRLPSLQAGARPANGGLPPTPALDYHEYVRTSGPVTSPGGGAVGDDDPAIAPADDRDEGANGHATGGDGQAPGHELHHAVLAILRPAILVGDLPTGIRLIEEEVAAHLGTSRGPVREALGVLRDEGLVSMAPRRGAVVTGLTPSDIDDLYDLRIVLECHAVRRAVAAVGPDDLAYLRGLDRAMVEGLASHAATDVAFHRHLLALARQERLQAAWERIAGIVGGLLAVTDGSRPDLVRHANLVAALEERDAESAAAMMHLHIRNAHRIMRGVLAARA